MCRNHGHVAAVPTGTVVLMKEGWYNSYRTMQQLNVEYPTGERWILPPFTIFYLPAEIVGELPAVATAVIAEPTDVPHCSTESAPTYTSTTQTTSTKAS